MAKNINENIGWSTATTDQSFCILLKNLVKTLKLALPCMYQLRKLKLKQDRSKQFGL
jgi:hypothetical protein